MVNVKVLFFGATAVEVGEREIEIEVESDAKADAIFRQVVSDFPQLEKHSLLFALNQEYSNGDEIVKSGDELAMFTAVSGG